MSVLRRITNSEETAQAKQALGPFGFNIADRQGYFSDAGCIDVDE